MVTNLKKVSIFIDSWLRKRLADKDSELLARAYGHATLFAPMLVSLLVSRKNYEPKELPANFQPMHKFLCGGWGESEWLRSAFNEAARLEATLKVADQGTVRVEVRFFQRSLKESHFNLTVNIDFNGNFVGGVACGMKRVSA